MPERPCRIALASLTALALCALSGCAFDDAPEAEADGLAAEGKAFLKRVFSKDTYQLYKPPIHQGNSSLLDHDTIARLRLDMRRDQVAYLLGKPLLPSTFHGNRWDYVYYHIPSRGEKVEAQLTVFFNDRGRVERICENQNCRS